LELIVFNLGSLYFGVDATKVREILTYLPPTRLPNTKKWISGVINIRGDVTPVIDLRVRFGTDENPRCDENIPIIAVKTADKRIVGMIADGIDTLVETEGKGIIDMPTNDLGIGSHFIKGIFLIEGKNIALVDTDLLLARGELE